MNFSSLNIYRGSYINSVQSLCSFSLGSRREKGVPGVPGMPGRGKEAVAAGTASWRPHSCPFPPEDLQDSSQESLQWLQQQQTPTAVISLPICRSPLQWP